MSKLIFSLCLMLCAHGIIHMSSVPLGNVKKFVLDYHNNFRRKEQAADMMKLSWNDQLAQEAGAWATRCNFVHQRKGRGENLAFDSNPGKLKVIIKNAIDKWVKEKEDSRRNSGDCYISCHYTQLVWSKTTEVGCAVERCPYLSAFGKNVKNALYFACFYNPRGNIGNNIYTPGTPCSKCPKGASCDNALCVADIQVALAVMCDVRNGTSHCTDSYNTTKCENWAKNDECRVNPGWMLDHCQKSCSVC